jgi:hypothetical protein
MLLRIDDALAAENDAPKSGFSSPGRTIAIARTADAADAKDDLGAPLEGERLPPPAIADRGAAADEGQMEHLILSGSIAPVSIMQVQRSTFQRWSRATPSWSIVSDSALYQAKIARSRGQRSASDIAAKLAAQPRDILVGGQEALLHARVDRPAHLAHRYRPVRKDALEIEPHGFEQRDIGLRLDLEHRVALEDRSQFLFDHGVEPARSRLGRQDRGAAFRLTGTVRQGFEKSSLP